MVGLVVAGIVAALAVGYAVGGNSRDDDASSAETQAAQADKSAAASEQALKDDQAQDEQAVQVISQGFEELGNAIGQENARTTRPQRTPSTTPTKDIQSGLEKLHGDVSENVNKALEDLSRKINDAVGSQSAENAQGNGG